jgi:hypothetical protein
MPLESVSVAMCGLANETLQAHCLTLSEPLDQITLTMLGRRNIDFLHRHRHKFEWITGRLKLFFLFGSSREQFAQVFSDGWRDRLALLSGWIRARREPTGKKSSRFTLAKRPRSSQRPRVEEISQTQKLMSRSRMNSSTNDRWGNHASFHCALTKTSCRIFRRGLDQGCASHSLPEFLERRWLYDSRDVNLSQIRECHAKESSTKFFRARAL